MSENRPHEVNLLDLIAFILRWRVFLITIVLVVASLVGIVSFVVKPLYRSSAIIRASEKSNQGLSGLLASKLSSLGGIGFAPALGEVPGEVYVSILKSRWMAERIIDEMKLREVYHMKTDPIDDVIKVFKRRTRFELDARSQTVEIVVDDHSAQRAQEIARFLVNTLDERNTELKTAAANRERVFMENRLSEARNILTALEDSLSRFQLTTGMLDLEEQVKATVGATATLEAQKLILQSELEMNRQIYSMDSPLIEALQLKIAGIETTLRKINEKRESTDHEFDLLLRLKETPEQGMNYLRLRREIEIQQILVALLIQQYEQARIDEQRNTPTIMRLDPPSLASKRVWPRRGLMIGISALSALIFGSAFALIREFWHRASSEPSHSAYERIQEIRHSLKRTPPSHE